MDINSLGLRSTRPIFTPPEVTMAYIIESSDNFMAQFNSVHLAVEPEPDDEDTGVRDSLRSLEEE